MKYLLFFLPSLALANFTTETGSITYAEKAVCEKAEKVICYPKPIDADTKSLKEVQVDDLEKPITDIDGNVVGYEQKLEKKFVEDPIKVSEKLAKENAEQQAKTSCEQFKTLLADSAIDSKSKPEDVMEVTRRLLGYWKSCLR